MVARGKMVAKWQKQAEFHLKIAFLLQQPVFFAQKVCLIAQ